MVTPDALFEKILTMEILLSMDGIIPSFSELKLRLTTTLDRFCHSLMTAGAPQEDVDRLCKILCLCIDARARTMLARQGLSWEGHALTHHYYGYHEEPVIVAEVLSPLLQQPACHIDLYAKRLLFYWRRFSLPTAHCARCAFSMKRQSHL
ncbi:DotU family type IV/VI secretion system protein [Cronobacter sakazakii]|uniref:DotU family type IV/VI secretion system protein n=1 Tax=Cronobacter sakazakii TaxID=28141 RepID=UPI001E286262|nr:DotU family type IV/VI secretion system protein [Cronobacter sakazakii]